MKGTGGDAQAAEEWAFGSIGFTSTARVNKPVKLFEP